MTTSSLKTVVVYANYAPWTKGLSYYDDWLDAFEAHPGFDCMSVDIARRRDVERLRREVRSAELIVLLHSVTADEVRLLDRVSAILQSRRGLLLAFVGNEVNIPSSPLAEKRRALRQVAPDYIATQLLIEAGEYLWGDLATRSVLAVPHALNEHAFRPEVPWSQRSIDIGVRANRYSATLGDEDRNCVIELFDSPDIAEEFVVDISGERLDRTRWAQFLNSCRATVSSEAGSWYLERDDATMNAIIDLARAAQGAKMTLTSNSPLTRLGRRLPTAVKHQLRRFLERTPITMESSLDAVLDPDEVIEHFQRVERPPVYGKVISSRHFDAIGTGTTQVLLSGRYNDLLVPGVHYIELRPDYSNLAEVLEMLRAGSECATIAERALEFVLGQHTYRHRLDVLFGDLD